MAKRLVMVAGLLGLLTAGPAAAQSLLPGGWSGPYWGLAAGGAWSDARDATRFSDLALSGHIGYGVQFSSFYVGAEADATWGGMSHTSVLSPLYAASVDVDWSATARGRAGIAIAGLLVYATAGAAWSGQSVGVHSLGQDLSSSSKVVSGLVYGAGVEMKVLPFVSARIEALHYDYAAQGNSFSDALPASVAATARKGLDLDETVVRAGVSLRFN